MSRDGKPTRDRILKTTRKLLEAGTGSAVRMSDIAKAAKISRQALYLHFPNRAELLIATTRHLDEVNDIDSQLAESRNATSGKDRLRIWVDVWGNYIPKIYGVGKALMAMKDSDDEAKSAWDDRMNAVRQGCAATVRQLAKDGDLSPAHDEKTATDLLWSLQSVRLWEHLIQDCGWSQKAYIEHIQDLAAKALIR